MILICFCTYIKINCCISANCGVPVESVTQIYITYGNSVLEKLRKSQFTPFQSCTSVLEIFDRFCTYIC